MGTPQEAISILNHVLGPIMRGPSSSHTAASYHLGLIAKSLLGQEPQEVNITFDLNSSYGRVYKQQGVDNAFACAFLGRSITDLRFPDAVDLAAKSGLKLDFTLEKLPEADHPNFVRMQLKGGKGEELILEGASIGGGAARISKLNGWPVEITGTFYEYCVEGKGDREAAALRFLTSDGFALGEGSVRKKKDCFFVFVKRKRSLPDDLISALRTLPGISKVREARPYCFVQQGRPLFRSAEEAIQASEELGLSLGELAIRYESQLLGLKEEQILSEMDQRLSIMEKAVEEGLSGKADSMQLLRPTAHKIYTAEAEGRAVGGGLHLKAACRALAAMHVNCSTGVVCAAPTAGSAGVIPGAAVTLLRDLEAQRSLVLKSLFAAGAVGAIVAERATFAAEVAGCQVEIGAASAMAASAVVEFAGGSAKQACDAAAVSFQNTMGSVCDLVQGIVEIPCHTRNAVGAASAFLCADLVLGGYENSIPLDETIDAVYSVGKMLPQELRVTALGGLAQTPSAKKLRPRVKEG